MPLLLRKIHRANWYENPGIPWLAEGELQADALVDLATKDNALSVWYVEDDASNLELIVTVLAAKCEHISNFDYALFHQELLSELSIKLESIRGDSPDEGANTLWHRHVVELSAPKLMELAEVILTGAEKNRFLGKHVRRLIQQGVASGRIERTKLKPGILTKIDG